MQVYLGCPRSLYLDENFVDRRTDAKGRKKEREGREKERKNGEIKFCLRVEHILEQMYVRLVLTVWTCPEAQFWLIIGSERA